MKWGIIDYEYMKVMYVNCGLRKKCESDLRSNEYYLNSSEKKAWKKNQDCTLSCSFLNQQFTYMIFTVFNMVSRSLLWSLFATLWLSLELEPWGEGAAKYFSGISSFLIFKLSIEGKIRLNSMKYDTEWTEWKADLSILKEKLVYSSQFKHGNYELLAECIFSFEGLI